MKEQNWEKEFDKEFPPCNRGCCEFDSIGRKELKQHIKHLLEEQKKERIPKEMKVYKKGEFLEHRNEFNLGWNNCIEEFNKLNK